VGKGCVGTVLPRECELAVFLERGRWESPTPNKCGTAAGERKGGKDGGGAPGENRAGDFIQGGGRAQ